MEKLFDREKGTPLYPIHSCEWPNTCSYPYCPCKVPHNRHDQPYRADEWVWHWSLVPIVIIGLVLWTFIVYTAIRMWP